MTVDQAKRVIKAIGENDITLNIMLWGPNGVGKTQIFRQLAEELNWKFWLENCPSSDRTNLAGIPFMKPFKRKDGSEVMVQEMAYPRYVVEAMDGEIVIVFDEVNRMPKDNQSALFELINERSINGQKLSNRIIIGLSGNPPGARFHAKQTDAAFNDRVVHILIETDPQTTLEYFKADSKDLKSKNPMHKDIISFLSKYPNKINKFDEQDQSIPVPRFPSPRNWKERVNRIWSQLNPIKDKYGMTEDTIVELIEGTLGDEAAEFIKYIRTNNDPITLDEVFNFNKEVLQKVRKYANQNEDGSDSMEGSIQLGMFASVCSEIERVENKESVRRHADSVLRFLSEIPSSFSFKVVSSLCRSVEGQAFWLPLLNTQVVNPQTNKNQLKYQKLHDQNMKETELQIKRKDEYNKAQLAGRNNIPKPQGS